MMPKEDMQMDNSDTGKMGGSENPGAVDSRLSLDPNDERWSDAIADFEDGSEYTLSVRVRQIAAGEFEVVTAEPEETDEEDGETEDAEDVEDVTKVPAKTGKSPKTAAASKARGVSKGITNPAVIGMLGKNR